MSLIVKKFGGSSVANAERVRNVARIITEDYKKGNQVITVVSAQGDTTDDLIDKMKEIAPNGCSKREADMLLSAGLDVPQCTALVHELRAMGIPLAGEPVNTLECADLICRALEVR